MPKRANVKPFTYFFNYEGMDDTKGVFAIQPSAAESIVNMHRDKNGEWSAYNQGYANFSSQFESGDRIDGLGLYTSAAGTDYLLVAVNGKMKSVNPSSGSLNGEISTGITANVPVDFETFKGSVYAVCDSMAPLKWAGSGSMSAASGWPVTNGAESYNYPTMVEQHANRLVFSGCDGYESHIVISENLAPESFTLTPTSTDTNGAVIQVSPGDGEVVTAMRSVNIPALGQQYLVIWKNRSIYALSGDTPLTFDLQVLNKSYGCVNNRCVVQVGTDFLFLGERNIYSLTTATQSGNLQPKAIGSRKVKDTLAQLNTTEKDKCWAVYLKDRDEVWFGIPTGSSNDVDTILVYSLPRDEGETNVWSIRNGFPQAPSCGIEYSDYLLTGAQNGYVNKWFSASDYAGTGFSYEYRYPYFNYGSQFQYKELVQLNAWFLLYGSESITFEQTWRGGGNENSLSVTRTVAPDSDLSYYGAVSPPAAVFGTDYFNAGEELVMEQLLTRGNGLQVQLSISGTTGSTGPIFLGFSGLVRYGKYARDYR